MGVYTQPVVGFCGFLVYTRPVVDFGCHCQIRRAVVAPCLVVSVCALEVVQKYVDHVEESEAMDPGHGGELERQAQADRQRAWMKRDSSQVAGASAAAQWRPRKKHRVGARNWALHLDNQAGLYV